MFIETRHEAGKRKYYLVHSYRIAYKVKRISYFLGSNLTKEQIEKARRVAESHIILQMKENTLLAFELRESEVDAYRAYDRRVEINHLQKKFEWGRFTQEFTYNTNAIEGSQVAFKEVQRLIDKEEKATTPDQIETLNVAGAIQSVRMTKRPLTIDLIKRFHRICFVKSKPFAGKFRDVEVVIKDKTGKIVHWGAPVKEINTLLNELIVWYKAHRKIYPPLLLAAVVHNQFEHIHPFQDGNGRVGRLLLNYVLLKHKYPPLNIRFVDRANYYKTLRLFDANGDVKPTLRFLISQYHRQYR